MTKKVWAGIDIGGTKVAIALVDEAGSILVEDKIPTEVEKGPDDTIDRMVKTLKRQMRDNEVEVQGIGVGSPGPMNAEQGIIQAPSNLRTWIDVAIKDQLEARLHIPTVLGNDANLAGLAEYRYGLWGKHQNMIYVTVSTGVGGGIISNGRLHTGSSDTAAEFGHMIVQKDGPLCGCGRHGCLETFSSGTGIANRMKEQVTDVFGHPLQQAVQADTLSSKEVFAASEEGDELAQAVIKQAEDYLAISLANVVNLVNPSVMVIGGGVALGQPQYMEAVTEKIADYAIEENMENLEYVQARLEGKDGVLGAASLSMIAG